MSERMMSTEWEAIETRFLPAWKSIECSREGQDWLTTKPLEEGEARVRQYGRHYRYHRCQEKNRSGRPMTFDATQGLRIANLQAETMAIPGATDNVILMYACAHLVDAGNSALSDEARTQHVDIAATFIWNEGHGRDGRIAALARNFGPLGVCS